MAAFIEVSCRQQQQRVNEVQGEAVEHAHLGSTPHPGRTLTTGGRTKRVGPDGHQAAQGKVAPAQRSVTTRNEAVEVAVKESEITGYVGRPQDEWVHQSVGVKPN